jgi:pimeloyl-ACP methyl ester carboxylesterase
VYLARSWRGVIGPGFAERQPEAFVELLDQISQRPTPHAGVMTQLRAIASWHGADRLARISAPTTVIHGTDDPLIPVGNGMRLVQMIPGATYIELPGIGHVVPFEAPDVLIAQLTTP